MNKYKIVKITKDIISDRKKLLSENFKYDDFGDGILIQFYNEEIETIVTHEQYEENCFRAFANSDGENEMFENDSMIDLRE